MRHEAKVDASVQLQARNHAFWITLNRPATLNALSPEVIAGIGRGLDKAQDDASVHAVVIAGEGRAFCAGADLTFIESAGPDGNAFRQFLQSLMEVLTRLERFPKPVIAAVNGLALAGGLELVLCSDIVLAARSARFGDAHANYGLLPGGGGSVRLPRRVGPGLAKHMMFTGDHESAETMAAAGLVQRVVDDDALAPAVEALVTSIAMKSPLAVARMKALVNDGLQQPLEVALRQELMMADLHALSFDMQEGLQAFKAKRRPRFTGR